MAEITASMVKDLREKTGAGMMDCKKALQEAEGDVEGAVQILREKGAVKAAKRAARATDEGRIQACLTDDEKTGVLVEVNCETDFCARNERFGQLVQAAADTALASQLGPGEIDAEKLLEMQPVGADAPTLKDVVTDTVGVIGENMGVGRAVKVQVPDGESGLVHAYIHPPGKVAVLVRLTCESDAVAQHAATQEVAHNVCLQIAFSSPAGLTSDTIPADIVAKEREVYRNQALNEGKPEKVVDKIVDGRMKAFFKESCLLDQPYVKEEKQSVQETIDIAAKAAGGKIAVAEFVRLQLGENAGEEAEDEE